MRSNLDMTHGALFSQRVLLALVEAGMSRDEAYRVVQEARSARSTPARRCASCIAAAGGPASSSTSTPCSTTAGTSATPMR
jgi:adenylosuccinate lyase